MSEAAVSDEAAASPSVVFLVPRREGFADRDAIWNWTRRWWTARFPDWRMVEGHHDVGLFNRAAAVNTASVTAGAWDVAVILDSDVICHPPNVREAVALAHKTGKLVVPFTVRHNLNRIGSRRIMDGDSGSWKRYIERDYHDQHSSVIAVSRRLWDAVGGMDEGFRGWGQEDTAFAIACETVADGRINLDGEVWHLWHAGAPEGKRGTPSATSNRARVERYKGAWGRPDEVLAIRADTEPDEALLTIPRILHRVVPEKTEAKAEQWWTEFAALHPNWRLMTHRDPLDPAEWPLTSKAWAQCQHGASLADLVRLEALLRWGGIYVDQDVQPIRSLEPLIGLAGFAAWEDERVVPNAVIGAMPHHPAIQNCLDLAVRRIRAGASIWDAGPAVTTKLLVGRPDFTLLPPDSFYPVHYKDPERERKMRGPFPPWTFAVHHYWGSWL